MKQIDDWPFSCAHGVQWQLLHSLNGTEGSPMRWPQRHSWTRGVCVQMD